MNTEPTKAEKIRRLPWSIAHSVTNNMFCQLTVFGTVFILFLDELGLPKTQIGFLLSLFPFFSIIALFIGAKVTRAGFKHVYITFMGIRKIVAAFLLLTPWILSRFGLSASFLYLVVVLSVFAICRAIAMTAGYPWAKEFIPDSIWGKYTAIITIVVTVAAALTIAIASYVVGSSTGLTRFMVLIATGVFFGFVSVWCAFFKPGGAPVRAGAKETAYFRRLVNVLKDRDFLVYLGGIAPVILVFTGLSTFIPLFMKDEVGLRPDYVVLLQIGTLFGLLLSGFLWGWAADRYGSRPVMLSGLALMVLLPVCWLLLPRHSVWSSSIAMGIAFLLGLASMGWGIGSNRFLYVSAVPEEKKTEYMAVYHAWMGLVGGCACLAAGLALDLCQGITGKFLLLTLDPYTPIFVVSFVLLILALLALRKLRAESSMRARRFVGMFFQGNPFLAFESMVRYGLAREESDRISMIERLGQARSPLSVDELLEALSDPSFNVRYEAIVSIARTRADARLLKALIKVLRGNEPDLSPVAASALGRIGDQSAIAPLREALASEYPLLQARSARALGALGDAGAIPLLQERFRNEPHVGLRIAYASALGALRASETVGDLLALLGTSEDENTRIELALALARMGGNERYFVHLWQEMRREVGTAVSQAVFSLRKKVKNLPAGSGDLLRVVDDCAEAFAQDAIGGGTALLRDMIRSLAGENFGETPTAILRECAERLDEFGAARIEYIVLSLHTLNAVL